MRTAGLSVLITQITHFDALRNYYNFCDLVDAFRTFSFCESGDGSAKQPKEAKEHRFSQLKSPKQVQKH